MGSPEVEGEAVVAEVLRAHGEGGGGVAEVVGIGRSIDMEWRKAEEAAIRRYEAANWLRRIVGVVCARDLAEEPSEEEFRLGLRNGIILCNSLNKVQPGSVPKVVEAPSDSAVPTDGAALCAYQYFENVRNFLIGLQDLGLPTFEASDLEKGGKGVRVVDCVLSLKSFNETKQVGRSNSFKYGGIVKPSMSGKHFIRKNSEPFMKAMTRSHSAELLRDGVSLEQSLGLDFSLDHAETTTSDSIRMLVQTILSDKKPEEIPSLVESLLSRVIHEFDRRIANQNDLVKYSVDPNDNNLLSRADKPPEMESICTCSTGKMDEEDNTCVSMKEEEVSTVLPVNGENVGENIQAKQTDESFDQQQKHIQDMKINLSTIKSGMEHIKLQYSEDIDKLGKHLHTLSHAASGYHKVLEENRKLYNQIQDLRGNIRVYCRVRPFLPGKVSSSSSVAGLEDRTITVMTPSKYGKDARKSFTFNRVFGPLATQEQVFADMQPLIRSVLDGYNVCIFAYGQTGSGKTFTMSGPKVLTEEGLGVNYRALNDLFDIQAQRKDTFCYEISVQMIEIYNEQVRDLLQNGGNKKVEIKNSSQKGIAVPDANIVPVTTTSDVIDLMNLGQKNRAVCSTAMNDRSSRSHSCLTVHVQGRDLTSRTVLRGCMHLVDLAGSERVDKSEVVGDRLKEAQHINKSLSALGDVIASLAQKNAHVPYRNSKLTQLLQDSLGGQAKTLMFVHIAPEPDAIGESISTLKFAERVATVELGAAKSNKEGGEVKELKEQIACLKAALVRKDGENESIRSTQSSPDIYRMRMGSAPPAFRHTMEEVGNLETRSNGTPRQKKRNFDLSDILVENDTSSWLDTSSQKESALGDWVDNSRFGSSNSLPELGPDATQDVGFYQRNSPEPQWSWAGSVATEDSDDFEATTSCSSEQDMVRPTSAPKASGLSNGSASVARKAQSKSAKSTDIRSANPAKRTPSLQKKLNGHPSTLIKNGKQSSLSGTDGKRTPNGKVSTKK
ncbi:kinesin-like protein KIN-14P [Oryza brachyantha]|uniref:kinesin-like protein KIN-14P n=1 Tax=Oryza brachyantha TaxID=4533 RepID=UPI000776029A|nr:kinesin-like protein KIN-14P [Oryza brachyantha]